MRLSEQQQILLVKALDSLLQALTALSTKVEMLTQDVDEMYVILAELQENKMVKTPPVGQLVGTVTFPTKGAAEKFAIEQRSKKAKSGYKTRYEIDMDPQTGQFRVREFVYATDEKGKLI